MIFENTTDPFENANVLYFDIESHSAKKQWEMDRYDFVRLSQYAWNDGPVRLTSDLDHLIEQIENADLVVAHNGANFDLPNVYDKKSTRPLELALEGKMIDTMVAANLVNPSRYFFTMRPPTDEEGNRIVDPKTGKLKQGAKVTDGLSPANAKRWLSLDNQCYQLGIGGKEGDLKALAVKYAKQATEGDGKKYSIEEYRNMGFGLIPLDDPDFVAYAEQDIISLRDLAYALRSKTRRSRVTWDYIMREMIIVSIDAQNMKNGFTLDIPVAEARVKELKQQRDEIMTQLVAEWDFPTEGKKPWMSAAGKAAILNILASFGITPDTRPDWEMNKTGPAMGGKVLKELAKDTEAEEVVNALASLMGQRSLSELALDSVQPDGKVHPDISRFQRSGRGCIPETHKILTRRGILHVDDIIPGEDETLDMRNRWVKIQEVHRYKDAPVNRYENERVFLEATPEHRWVQRTEAGKRTVEPLDPSKPRRTLQLAPDAYPFDPHEMDLWSHMTPREWTAALVGFLVTDGYASNRADSPGSRFVVYQTENKFYKKIREFLGDWVTSDYTREVHKHPDNIIHEMRLKTTEVEDLLTQEGLDWQGGLRNNPTLFPWVLSLSKSETEAFLTAVYISDGTVRAGTPEVANSNPNKVDVIQVAAYRMGRRTNSRLYENTENYQVKGRVALTRDRVNTRNLPVPETYTADVWCVTTETGTFTAWYPEGRWSGPYLTGNSVQNPGLTIWSAHGEGAVEKRYFTASPGRKLQAFDYSNADARIVAAYSGDPEYAKRFEDGFDSHEMTGRFLFGDELYDSDPKYYRNRAKPATHTWGYRGGKKPIMKSTKAEEHQVQNFLDNMDDTYPDVKTWQNLVTKEGERGTVINDWGRVMVVDKDRSFTQSPALYGQSGTREILCDALIRIAYDDIRVVTWLVAQIHDELIFDIPEEELWWAVDYIQDMMDTVFEPKKGGQAIDFPASPSKPSWTWEEAGHD